MLALTCHVYYSWLMLFSLFLSAGLSYYENTSSGSSSQNIATTNPGIQQGLSQVMVSI